MVVSGRLTVFGFGILAVLLPYHSQVKRFRKNGLIPGRGTRTADASTRNPAGTCGVTRPPFPANLPSKRRISPNSPAATKSRFHGRKNETAPPNLMSFRECVITSPKKEHHQSPKEAVTAIHGRGRRPYPPRLFLRGLGILASALLSCVRPDRRTVFLGTLGFRFAKSPGWSRSWPRFELA